MIAITQANHIPSIAYNPSNMSVNIIDAEEIQTSINFTQLPSVKQNAAKLKPNALIEKEQEIATILETVRQLESEHVSYNDQFITRGNQALYAILAKVYALAIQITHSDNCESILKKLRSALSLQKNIKTQKNSSAMTMIVRWVVGGSRQTAHTYSKALDAAYKDNIAAQDLAEYINKCGGINNAVKKNTKQLTEKSNTKQFQFSCFMSTADSCSANYENTDILWTENIFGDAYALNTLILTHSSGGGKLKGQRAFGLSAEAYSKICKILAQEVFKDKRDDQITSWVSDERQQQGKTATAKRAAVQTV